MANATLERGSTSIEIPLLADSSGTPVAVRGIGKPHLNIQETGALNPRFIDQWSGLEQYTLQGRLFDFQKARDLLQLIKSNSNGNELTLNIDMPDYDSNITVAPSAGSDQAVSLVFPPGYSDYVEVDLSLTRVQETASGANQSAMIPTDSGSGPIQLKNSSIAVELASDVEITWSAGRPKSVVRKDSSSKYPIHYDKFKTATETFELSFEFVENTVSQTNDVVDLFNRKLGRNPIYLDFQGLYGLGEFPVIPDGSEALRHNRQAGYKSSGLIPSVNLRRVLDPTA